MVCWGDHLEAVDLRERLGRLEEAQRVGVEVRPGDQCDLGAVGVGVDDVLHPGLVDVEGLAADVRDRPGLVGLLAQVGRAPADRQVEDGDEHLLLRRLLGEDVADQVPVVGLDDEGVVLAAGQRLLHLVELHLGVEGPVEDVEVGAELTGGLLRLVDGGLQVGVAGAGREVGDLEVGGVADRGVDDLGRRGRGVADAGRAAGHRETGGDTGGGEGEGGTMQHGNFLQTWGRETDAALRPGCPRRSEELVSPRSRCRRCRSTRRTTRPRGTPCGRAAARGPAGGGRARRSAGAG